MSFDLDRDTLVRHSFSILEMKMSPGTQAERESSGFCSGEELEDPDTDSSSRSISDIESRENKSATPNSIKSDHVPISNKRKFEDTNNNNKQLEVVKRLCSFDSRLSSKKTSSSPFRPWDDSKNSRESSLKIEYQEEPLSLVKEKKVESEEQEMPLDFRKKVFPFKSKTSVPEDSKPVLNTNLNFINSSYPYSMFRTNPLLASPIHQIRNPISIKNPLLSRSSKQPAPFKPLIVHKDPVVDSIPLIPPNLLIPSPLLYSKPFVDNKFLGLNARIKKEDDIRIKEEHPVHDFKKIESILRRDVLVQNGLSIKQEPSDSLVSKAKPRDTNRTTPNMKSIRNGKTYSEKHANSNKVMESFIRVPKKHERSEDLKIQNSCISNDSTESGCTMESDETVLNDNSYKKKCSSSQNYNNRNYKNMTRERRIEANARERTRVHTISAAFETLRKTVPAYSTNQKLSKLSVLRIACSYIMTLSRIAGHDYSSDQSEPSIESCVEDVTKTIQSEGKVKKKSKDDDDED